MALILDSNGAGSSASSPAADAIKDGDTSTFKEDVIDASMQTPVIVDFWAPWCGPCKQLTPALEKVVREARGRVRLVKIDIDQNQNLAAQLRIQSVPTVYAFFQGQPVDAFAGAKPESQLREFVKRLAGVAGSPDEDMVEQGYRALEKEQYKTATELFSKALSADPGNGKAIAGLLRSRIGLGDVAGARRLVDSLSAEQRTDGLVAAAVTAIELAEQKPTRGTAAELEKKVAANPGDHQARFDLANALFAEGRAEAAIDHLLEIVKRDRGWNEDGARTQLLKYFDALGPQHPLTAPSRRRLSTMLFS